MSESRDDDGEWPISLDDLEGEEEATPNESAHEPVPIEPGDPTVEGVAFVVLGVALTLTVLLAGI